ncbi:hypothetical protein N9O39_00680 [Candidatus Pelagibacter sp.]|nr:hypothetical protein [Candidatus Pelagibacter sp.]
MTRARDIANLLGTNTNGIIDNAKITLDAAEVPNLAASKITSGTFADARIAASNVSQHASSFDDNPIVNDISTLALRQASDGNRSAYNTNSQFVDVFQDGTGIASNTNAPRNDAEFVATVASSTATADAGGTDIAITDANTRWSSTGSNTDRYSTGLGIGASYNYNFLSSSDGSDANHTPDSADALNTGNTKIFFPGVNYNGGASATGTGDDYYLWGLLSNYTGMENTNLVAHSAGSGIAGIVCATAGQQQDIRVIKVAGGNNIYVLGTIAKAEISSATSVLTMARMDGRIYVLVDDVVKFTVSASDFNSTANLASAWSFGRGDVSRDFITPKYRSGMTAIKGITSTIANATGNFISNAITAPSSVSKMGAIITYQNQEGVNALNTDIVLQLSADNGSNFTTATMTAMPDFASGIKMAKVNDLSVTAGTQLKYKISFANQASGSKEARIRGVSLQY